MFAFLRENFRWIAGGFLLTYFSSFGQTFFISASVAHWRATLDLTQGEMGRLYMLATLGSALCLPWIGRLVDLVSPRRAILLVMPVLAAATLLAAHAPSLAVLALAIFLLRLFGQGMMTHIAMTTTGRWFEAQRGRAVSLVVLGHQGGEATLPLAFASVTLAFGHQVSWSAAGGFLLLLGLPAAWWCYRVPREPRQAAPGAVSVVRHWTRREVLADPLFWVLLTGVLGPSFIGTTIFYHQDYLTALHGWSPLLFTQALAVAAITTVVFALVCGALVDRFRATALLPFFLLPLAGACFLLGIDGAPVRLFAAMFLLGVAYGVSSTLFGALWPELYGTRHLGAVRSITVSAMVLATAAGPGVTATLIDRGISVPVQLRWLGAYCLLAGIAMLVASVRLRRRRAVQIGGD